MTSQLFLLSNNRQCMVPRKIKGMPCLSVRSGRWLLKLPLAEWWGSPSSPSQLSHLGVGVIWLPRPSAVLVAFWARDLALFQRCSVSVWRGVTASNTSKKANMLIATGLPCAGPLALCVLKAQEVTTKDAYRLPHAVYSCTYPVPRLSASY